MCPCACRERRIQNVARVLDHHQGMLIGDHADRIPIGHVAAQARRENSLGARAGHVGDLGGVDLGDVDLVGGRIDVDEDRDEA